LSKPTEVTVPVEYLEELIQLAREHYIRGQASQALYPRTKDAYRRREAIVEACEDIIYGEEPKAWRMGRHNRWRRTGKIINHVD